MPPATRCYRPSPTASAGPGRCSPWPAGAVRSSWPSAPSSGPTSSSRWRSGSGWRWRRRRSPWPGAGRWPSPSASAPPWSPATAPTDFAGIDLIPSDFSFRNLDVVLDAAKDPGHSLARVVRPLTKRYDHVFLDCPPSISRLSENVFNAADALLVPIIPTTLSLRALDQLDAFLARRAAGGKGVRSPLVLPFFSMVDRRKKLHRELIEDLCLAHPDILRTAVPSSAAVERMGAHQSPVAAFDHRCGAVTAYAGLWDEVLARLAD